MKSTLIFSIAFSFGIFSTFAQIANEAPQITHVKTDVKCFGESSGAISALITGGQPPYSFSWDNGSTNLELSELASGSYTLTVVDAAGSVSSRTIEITQPEQLRILGNVTNPTNNSSFDGEIAVQIEGGTPFKWTSSPYQFNWSNNTTSLNQSEIGPGNYQLTVNDYNGCTASKQFKLKSPISLVTPLIELSNPIMVSTDATVYPNPANSDELITIQFEKHLVDLIVLMSENGTQFSVGNFGDASTITLNQLDPGNYYVKLFRSKTLVGSYRLLVY
jgi:hypothetical protein